MRWVVSRVGQIQTTFVGVVWSSTSVTQLIGRPENTDWIQVVHIPAGSFALFYIPNLHMEQGNCKGPILQSWIIHDVQQTLHTKILWRQPKTGKPPPPNLTTPLHTTSRTTHSYRVSHLPSLHGEAIQAPRASSPASATVEPTLASCGAGGTLSPLCWIYNEVLKFRIHMQWLVVIYSFAPSWGGRIRRGCLTYSDVGISAMDSFTDHIKPSCSVLLCR